MTTKPGTSECIHLTEEGCGVYEDRPAACRYYALGNVAVRKKMPEKSRMLTLSYARHIAWGMKSHTSRL